MTADARATWQSTPMPAVTVPEAVGSVLAAAMREALDGAGWSRYALLDRGSYEIANACHEATVFAALETLASEVTGRELRIREARALRLSAGDYLLTRHDRVHSGRPIELLLDLSERAVPDAEVHYRHRGQVYFTVPTAPGALTLVERGPTVMCNHTYLSRLDPDARVIRLIALCTGAPFG